MDDGIFAGLAYMLAIAAVAAVILFLLPVFIFVVEIVIVLLVVVLGFLLRVVFRRPWLVDAETVDVDPKREFVWAVTGLRRSRETVDEVARQLEAGAEIPVVRDAKLLGDRSVESSRS